MRKRGVFDSLSPLDFRYWDEEVAEYLSENAFTRYKLRVETALVRTLARRGLCSQGVVREVEVACAQVTTEEVYGEEDRIHHDIRALVNCIGRKVSLLARSFVHRQATSYDIIDTANAARFRDVVLEVLVPSLVQLEGVLIGLVVREATTKQIGRTHGQHAVPITFGFAIAGFVSRLGGCIEKLQVCAKDLKGKFSGAVGAYNATYLFIDDPERFEREVLWELGLQPAEHSTQIVPPEVMARLLCEVTITAGVLADLANDMRQLQRTEIGEVGESFEGNQVGSSTMPQKRNPINFENIVSGWKTVVSRIVTVFMDQISEHQRDLTNSASSRTYGEMIAYVVAMTKRMTRIMRKLEVDQENLARNLASQGDLILAEPLYLILADLGHPEAHETVRRLTLWAQKEQQSLVDIALGDPELEGYFGRMTPYQREALARPAAYTGIAAQKAEAIASNWKKKLNLQQGKEN